MKKPVICLSLLVLVAVVALAAGPVGQFGALFINATELVGQSSGSVWTFRASNDNVVGAATTDTLTHKTYDTAGAGNVFKINGAGISAVRGNSATVVLAQGAYTNNHFLSADSNGNAIDSGVVVPSSTIVATYNSTDTEVCAPAGCATFGASPQTPSGSNATTTLLAADLVANAQWTFTIHGAVQHDSNVEAATNTFDEKIGGATASCGFSCTGGSCGNSHSTPGVIFGKLRILTTGAGGTAFVQCSNFTSDSLGAATAVTNTTGATISINTTGNVSVGPVCTTTADNVKCLIFDQLFTKIN